MTGTINLKKNVSIAVTARVLSMLTGFLVSIFVTRYLGAELKGKMSYFLALSGTVWLILDLGFHKSLPYLLAKDPQKLDHIFSFSTLSHFLDLGILTACVFAFKSYFFQKLEVNQFIYLYIFIFFTAINRFGFVIKFIMLGIDRILWQNLLKLLPALGYLILFLALKPFVNPANKYLYTLIVMIAPLAVLTYYYYFLILKKHSIRLTLKIDFIKIFEYYKTGIRAFLSSFFIFLLIRFDIFLIKHYLPLEELGIYSLAANFVTILQTFSNLVGSLLLPKFSADSDNEKQNVVILRRISLIFFFIMLLIALIFFTCGRFVITLVYGNEFIPTFSVFTYLIPAVFFLSLGSLINTYFWSKGFPIKTIIFPLIALLVNIILNLFLIPAIGINGAAIATSVSYGVWLIMLLYLFFNSSLVNDPRLIIWQKSDLVFMLNEINNFRKRLLK